MAKNREPEKPVASETESGEEEEEGSSEEEESESESEQTLVAKKPSSSTPATLKKAQPQASPKPPEQPQKQPSSSSDEEESESESESESDGPQPNVKPIASKPMDDTPVSNSPARKSRSKPNATDVVTPAKSAASKRPAEEKPTEVKDAKKSKKKPDIEKPEMESSEKKPNDDPKKLLFQRLWSEDDEIEILKGMIDYAAKKKSDPVADLSAFHDYIRKNLHVDVTRTQLQDKIRRLKKKYENNKSKEKEGKNRTFSKPHEHKAYELSKKIWGNDGGKETEGERVMESPKANGGSVRKSAVKRAIVTENDEAKDAKTAKALSGERENVLPMPTVNSVGMSVEDRVMRMGAELFETGKGLEEEREWKRLKVEELEVHLKQLEVRRAQAKLVLDVLKSEDH